MGIASVAADSSVVISMRSLSTRGIGPGLSMIIGPGRGKEVDGTPLRRPGGGWLLCREEEGPQPSPRLP